VYREFSVPYSKVTETIWEVLSVLERRVYNYEIIMWMIITSTDHSPPSSAEVMNE
jgi:hypothetical protein